MTQTQFGTLFVGTPDKLYEQLARQILEVNRIASGGGLVSLTGGSTPANFYRWCAANRRFDGEDTSNLLFSTSDERLVPLSDPESNFGNASRGLLDAIGVPPERRFPWAVDAPQDSAERDGSGPLHPRHGGGWAHPFRIPG